MKIKNLFRSTANGGLLTLVLWMTALSLSAADIKTMRVNDLDSPMGIDQTPRFSWTATSAQRGGRQTAYEITVTDDAGSTVWNSGKVSSAQNYQIAYDGTPLQSKTTYRWRVRIWDQNGSSGNWSDWQTFETAMLNTEDWTARWLMADEDRELVKVTHQLPTPVTTRYIRIDAQKLGLVVSGESGQYRMQLSEVEVLDESGNNVALNKTVTVSPDGSWQDIWCPANLTDGRKDDGSHLGTTTDAFSSQTPTGDCYVMIDLGSDVTVKMVVIYPRFDNPAGSDGSKVANFPQSYTISTRQNGTTSYTQQVKVTDGETPAFNQTGRSNVVAFGRQFSLTKSVRRARMYASGAGIFTMTINGQRVTDRALEPGESYFPKTVFYATYDVTSLLQTGQNECIALVSGAMYHNPSMERYQKLTNDFGPLRFIAQLEVEYEDGTTETLNTDSQWKYTSKTPYTFCSWYGGEDYDASYTTAPVSAWNAAVLCEKPIGELKAQFYQPTQVVETWKPVAVNALSNGHYVIDFGQNFAGQYTFTLSGTRGQTIQLWPAELLNSDGSIRQDNDAVGYPVYDQYTFSGNGAAETWGPEMCYHGFRYLEISGLTTAPSVNDFTARRIRMGAPEAGSFNCSNTLLNEIHKIIVRSIASNLYNSSTDCPHREKLGWLEQTQLLYNGMTDNFDLAAWSPKLAMDTRDSQHDNGYICNVAPYFYQLNEFWGNDPSWGGATILVPYRAYLRYGDRATLEKQYSTMKRLMDYYATRSSNSLLDINTLGDWGAYDTRTSVKFTINCTYYALAQAMADIANILDESSDAATYTTLAAQVRAALNRDFYHSEGYYDANTQADNAMAIYYGVVEEENKEKVLASLLQNVYDANYHLTTGEVALRPLFMTLANEGHNNIVYKMATAEDMPSYGYFIRQGATTLPEFWDMRLSQNHCMMGHIDDWFYSHLAGIQNTGVAYSDITIQPYFAPKLTHVSAENMTTQGRVAVEWTRSGENDLTLNITVPFNATANLVLPSQYEVSENGTTFSAEDLASLGSGTYSFLLTDTSHSGETPDPSDQKAAISHMKVENLSRPMGIDTAEPRFSWQIQSEERNVRQTAYQIVVTDDDGAEVWNTGTVESPLQYGIKYAGTPLQSRTAYTWTLTLTTTEGTTQATSTFETAFMNASEWEGQWIHADASYTTKAPYVIEFATPISCRYVQLNVSELGLRASSDAGYSFVQLSELEIYSGGTNVARSATFTPGKSADAWDLSAWGWSLSYLNDGLIYDSSKLGWTTEQNVTVPVIVTADLGSVKTIDRIVLYPRQNDHATGQPNDIAANFPAAFTIRTSSDNSTYDVAYEKVSEAAPNVPYFAKTFSVDTGKQIERARIYASALGVFTMKINGQPVTDAVLEPGESEYEKTVLYSTYDVTPLLQQGDNAIVAQVAGGIYNIDYLAGRFSKGEVQNNGKTALMAELHIDYTDGTSDRIVTDNTWKCTASPTLGSNWWGGEDYDARRCIADIASPSLDLSAWKPVTVISPHFESPHSGVSGHGVLRSRMYEPLRVVEEWPAVSVKTIQSGGYTLRMVDFGRNFAGQYRFRLKGRAGQKISLRCGESLNPDGSVAMENFYTGASDQFEEYTFSGDADGETWGPEFMYHGFRYLQIIGLDEEPQASDFTAMRIRSDVENFGVVETSKSLINDIHVICRDAIASQLYNSITDCPHREKLGWLDVPNEMYVSLNMNFDMQSFYKKVVMDCFDAQQSNGQVPSVAPFYMRVYEDDTNWGGAAILIPYRNWRYYGDTSLMEMYYDQMKRLCQHFTDNTTGYIVNNSFSVLSDWGQETAGVSPMVPTEFTETTTYYYILRCMAEMAEHLGHSDDGAAYNALADNVRTAFNARFYNAETAVYTSVSGGGGRQSEQAQPLYYGLVPDGDEQRVADVLAQTVQNDGYKIKTGEIALKCVFESLANYGYNDIVWQMANQTDCPSYGYWVTQGYTTTPEYWDVGDLSQNHCMMDHIEEWFFTHFGGIQNTGTAFDHIAIRPYVPENLRRSNVSTQTTYGTVRSAWQRNGSTITFDFDIPVGTEATLILPVEDGKTLVENGVAIAAGTNGILSVNYADGLATVACGSGSYQFTTAMAPVPDEADDETFWLPVHTNDELPTGSVIRFQTFDGSSNYGRYIGYSGSYTVSDGKFLTGAPLSTSVPLTVTQDTENAPLFKLYAENTQLGIGDNNTILWWSASTPQRFELQFSGETARLRYYQNTSSPTGYVCFWDGGANSGIRYNGSTDEAQTWMVQRRDLVSTQAAIRLATVHSGIDRMDLTRAFAEGWNTVCLPFPMTKAELQSALGSEVEVAEFIGTRSDTEGIVTDVCFQVVENVAAHTPYLIYVPQEKKETLAQLTGIVTTPVSLTVNPEGSAFSFVGSYDDTDTDIAAGDYVLTTGNTFKRAAGGNRLRPFRAYLKDNGTAAVKASNLNIDFDGIPTGIESEAWSVKSEENHFTTESSRFTFYDLSGRQLKNLKTQELKNLPKGVYIVGHRKVLVE